MKLIDLNKNELLHFISNNMPDVNVHEDYIQCAFCEKAEGKYYYICDKCEIELKK